MIIYVTETKVELQEAENFKAFKIVNAGVSDLAAALRGTATVDADGQTAWVSQEAVKRLGPAQAEWHAAFDKMIESVKKHGWVNEADATVRAHIEASGWW
jgi:hypothetical protein